VLDLYSGVGLFALGAASTSEEVVGIEANETAVADASANARENRNVRFLQGDVGEALAGGAGPDCEQVILDPPRSGAGLDNVAAIVARKPQAVIYVSCDPPTLGRDLAAFGRAGYEADFLRAFDMFPDTFHLETVVRIRPR
jgi:23S rRNA (uracil1939-C5)-methyltransferase